MDKLINVVKVGEPIPSLDNKINIFGGDLCEIQKEDGGIFRLLKSQYEKRKADVENAAQVYSKSRVSRRKYSRASNGRKEYWEFIRYLARNSKIGGFQAVESKINQLKIDYFNATGEELKDDQFNPNLSPETYGNAMRIYFKLPENFSSVEELNDILPGDVEAKRWSDESNEYCISRMPFVLELLSIGFRHGRDHNIAGIEENIRRFEK